MYAGLGMPTTRVRTMVDAPLSTACTTVADTPLGGEGAIVVEVVVVEVVVVEVVEVDVVVVSGSAQSGGSRLGVPDGYPG